FLLLISFFTFFLFFFSISFFFFFFNDTATTEIYTLSLHDALPISLAFVNTMLAPTATLVVWTMLDLVRTRKATAIGAATGIVVRSEEHTSELQSRGHLVCRLLLEKKKKKKKKKDTNNIKKKTKHKK